MEVAEADAVNAEKVRLQPPGKGGTRLPVPKKGEKQGPRRVTVTVKQAIEAAIQPGGCHPQGLAGWLIERAKGSLGDRQIFAAMVNKALPLQVQANVDGGIRLELGWLSQRQVGTPAAQIEQQPAQVLDLQRENDGTYRIIDPGTGAERVPADGQAPDADAIERPTRPAEG